MARVRVETFIKAPPDVVFDLARDIDVHVQTTSGSAERAVDGVTSGKMGLGDWVTFEARHFRFRHRLTSKITVFQPHHRFIDEMQTGPYPLQIMRHEHVFEGMKGGTVMADVMEFSIGAIGIIGWIIEYLVVKPYLKHFLMKRAEALKAIAERKS